MKPKNVRALCILIVLALLAAGVAHADTYVYQLLVDTDNNPATGCGVPIHDAGISATFPGVEQVLEVTVDRTATGGTVTGVTLAQCAAGVFGPARVISSGGWPVGRGTGVGGADVVETSVPFAEVGNGNLVRVAFTASPRAAGSDVMVSVNGTNGGPILFQLPSAPVPLLTAAGTAACAALLGAAAFAALRRRVDRRAAWVLVLLAGTGVASVALALTIQLDGEVQDWQSLTPVATDPEGDSSLQDAAEDLVAGFLTADGFNLYVRFDVVDVNVCASKSDGSPVPGCCFVDTDCTAPKVCGGGGVPNLCSDVIGWANLQWPPTLAHTISVITRTDNVYGQVWIGSVTSSPGATPGLSAQVGFGPPGSDPAGNAAWTWVDATFNTDAGNNDEFVGSFLPEATGTFDYVYRYSTAGGLAWLYADLNGPVTAGSTPPNPGKMTVSASSDTTSPFAPTGLNVTSASPIAIDLAWNAVLGDATLYGYEVLRGASTGGPYTQLARLTGTTYSDAPVVQDATYFYVVRSVDLSFNRSGFSNEANATAAARTVTVTFNVTVPASTDATGRSAYIAGTLDRLDGGLPAWNPAGVVLTRVDATHWTITLTGDELTQIEYKYTLGSWDYIEKDNACGEIANRSLTLSYGGSGTQTVNDTVQNWRNVAPCGN